MKESLTDSAVVQGMGWRYRLAGWLMVAQGVLMELSAALALPVLLALGVEQSAVGESFQFALPYLQENLFLMMGLAGVFGALRVVGAVAFLRDRLWGLALTVIMCMVTLILMMFLLPAGIADGLFSGGALILILVEWFGPATVTGRHTAND